jgi:hypothetical protein
MKHLIILPLIALVSPALANQPSTRPGGFSTAELVSASQRAKGSPAQAAREIVEETERLRLAIAYDAAAGIGIRNPDEQVQLATALATSMGMGDLRAKWFMAGAILRDSTGSRTRLYNPLARGWLTLDWTKNGDGKWVVIEAHLSAAAPSDWALADGPYLASLIADYAAVGKLAATAPGDLAGQNADNWIVGVAGWLREPANAKAASIARTLIVTGRTARLGGGAIDMMPARARATFWPIAGFTREGGAGSLIYGSALYPHILIAADFGAGREPKPQKFTFVNLANAGAAQ